MLYLSPVTVTAGSYGATILHGHTWHYSHNRVLLLPTSTGTQASHHIYYTWHRSHHGGQ